MAGRAREQNVGEAVGFAAVPPRLLLVVSRFWWIGALTAGEDQTRDSPAYLDDAARVPALVGVALAATATLAFTWVGYPLLIAVLARLLVRPRAAPLDEPPTVTVVIATREDDATIAARTADVAAADYPRDLLQIVVALDTSGDANRSPALSDPRITVVSGDVPGGKASTLNAGVRAATGAILIFADSHQRFDANTISELVGSLQDSRVGGVSGQLSLPQHDAGIDLIGLYWQLERWLRRNEGVVHSTVGVTGAVWAMRRELWIPLPRGLILDDVFTPMRLVTSGYRVAFNEHAIARETRQADPEREYGRKVRTLTGVYQLCAWLPSVLVPVRNPIWLQFVCHKLLRLVTPAVLGVAAVAWAIVAGEASRRHPVVGAAAIALGATTVLALIATGQLRRAWHAVKVGVLMQVAIVEATRNALLRRWEVWTR
jgi:hypothetical protein